MCVCVCVCVCEREREREREGERYNLCIDCNNIFFINAFKILEGRSNEKKLRDIIVDGIAQPFKSHRLKT